MKMMRLQRGVLLGQFQRARWIRSLRSLRRLTGRALVLLLVTAGCILVSIPFAWMVTTSIKPPWQVWIMPPVWIPAYVELKNYIEPWSLFPFLTFYRNTITLVVFNLMGTMVSSSIVAFGFARVRFRGRGLLFLVLLSTMMLPGQVTLIPVYVLFSRLGWVNTLKPLIVPSYFGSAFDIFLLRQFMMTISPELDDAARMDGCGWGGIFRRIILPLSKPALGVVAIFSFTWNWNNFFRPLIYLNSMKLFPIALGLRLMQSRWEFEMQHMMAMTVVSIIPLLILFFIAQRQFIQGIVLTGVKG